MSLLVRYSINFDKKNISNPLPLDIYFEYKHKEGGVKNFIKRHVRILGLLGAVVIGVGGAASVYASLPSPEGVVNGCYSNTTGQLSVIDSTATCGIGNTALDWDRGVLAFGYLELDTSDPEEFVPVLSHSRGVGSVTLSPTATVGYCIELSGSLESNMRFPHIQATAGDVERPLIFLANTSSSMATVVSDACSASTDAFIDTAGSPVGVNFSIF